MKYKNITSGIVPVLGRGQVVTNGTIDLSEEEVQNPEIAVYIDKYLVPAKGVKDVPVEISNEKDASIKAPKDKTPEELEAEKKKAEEEQTVGVGEAKRAADGSVVQIVKESKKPQTDEQTVGVGAAEKTVDGSVVRTVNEIKKSQVDEELKKIRAILAYDKKVEYIQSIDNLVLLQALEVEEKTKAIVQARIKELSK